MSDLRTNPGKPRARFIASAVAVLGTPALLRGRAPAAQFEYKWAYPDAPELPTAVRVVQMASAIKAETNGRLDIKVFGGGILGSPASMFSQLRLGSIQFYSTTHSYFAALVPPVQIIQLGFAFKSSSQAFTVMDGTLGTYLRKELEAKGIYIFEKTMETGFRQVTSYAKPIRSPEDFVGFKVRVLPVPIVVDMFKALGATPAPIDVNELYTALQTHLVDGQENSFLGIDGNKFAELQRYLSMTNHIWGGEWMAANLDAWNALPPDIQAVVQRNAAKYALIERRDMRLTNVSLADKFKRQGLAFNTPDTTAMRARLGQYYAHWKNEFGATAWNLLEAQVGKLG